VQQTSDLSKLKREHSINLEPVKRDDQISEINLRSIITMDGEPMTFLQAFQGALIILTNEFLMREPQTYEIQSNPN